MKSDTLNILEDLKNGQSYMLTKSDIDEVFETLQMLQNFSILKRNIRNEFIINGIENIDKIEKIIQFKNMERFKEWLINQKKENNSIIQINEVKIGQYNKDSNFYKSTNKTIFDKEKNDENSKNFLLKIWNLISENPLISTTVSGLIIALIFYLIYQFFGVDLS